MLQDVVAGHVVHVIDSREEKVLSLCENRFFGEKLCLFI